MHGMVMMSHAWYGDGESCKVLMSHAFMHGDDDMGHTPYPTCMGHTPYPTCMGHTPYPICMGHTPYPTCMGHTPYPTCMGHTPYPLPVFSGNRASAGRSRHPACPG